MKTGRLSWWLVMWFGGIVLVTSVAILTGVLISKSAAEKRRAELIRLGEPLDVASLEPVKFPEENNGGPAAVAAGRELADLVKKHKIGLVAWGPSQPSYSIAHRNPSARLKGKDLPWPELATQMEVLQEPLTRIRVATESPIFGLNLDYQPALTMEMDWLTPLIVSTQYLAIDNLLRLRESDAAGALRNIQTQLRLAELAKYHRNFMAQLTSSIIIRIASSSTWEFIESDSTSAADLEQLQKLWTSVDLAQSFADSVRMERAFGLPTYRLNTNALETDSAKNLLSSLRFAFWGFFFRYGDELQFLNDHQNIIDQFKPSASPDRRPAIAATDEIRRSLEAGGIQRAWGKLLYSTNVKIPESIILTEVARNLTIVAIAIKRYQLAHAGTPPPTLNALVPTYFLTIPVDPLSGQIPLYQAKEDDFLLYSIGLDGIDGHGDLAAFSDPKKTDWLTRRDLVWPRPGKAPTPAP